MKCESPKLYSPLALAFLGDAVFEILVRERLVLKGNAPVNSLHQQSIRYVCAQAQSRAVDVLLPLLTPEEEEIFRRGRNASVNVPKSASTGEYHRATGLEALFGFLYLKGEQDRIQCLFDAVWEQGE